MKRLTCLLGLMLILPQVAFSAVTQQAQIQVTVVTVDPLSYNIRPLNAELAQLQANKPRVLDKSNAGKLPACQKTIYFNKTSYQITATKSSKGAACSIDTLGNNAYGIMLNDF